jgi:hypothetical protein
MRARNLESAFSLVELTISLVLTTLILVGAYRVVTSSQLQGTGAVRASVKSSDLRQMQGRLIADLKEALPVRSTICDPLSHPQGWSPPAGCAGFILSSITPLFHDQTLDGAPLSGIDAIRVVLPKKGSSGKSAIKLATAMTVETEDVRVKSVDATDLAAGGFALIDDGNTSDVFLITRTDEDGEQKKLSHSTSPWNSDDGLSTTYTDFATIRPVTVVTIGVEKTPEGNQLIWRDESNGVKTVLATAIDKFQIAYRVFGATAELPSPCATGCVLNKDFQGIQRLVFSLDYVDTTMRATASEQLTMKASPDRIAVALRNL